MCGNNATALQELAYHSGPGLVGATIRHLLGRTTSSIEDGLATSTSLIGHSGSSAFRLSTTPVSMSLAGSRFSPDSAPRPFHHGFRRRGGTIFRATLPSM